jgi:hypothetical protein
MVKEQSHVKQLSLVHVCKIGLNDNQHMLFTCGYSILQHSSIVIVEIVQQLIGGVRALVIHLADGMINGSSKEKNQVKIKAKD